MRTINTKLQVQVRQKKHKLIYFSQTQKNVI